MRLTNIIAVLCGVIMLGGCNDTVNTTESVTPTENSFETSVAVTKKISIPALAEYKSVQPIMKQITKIAEKRYENYPKDNIILNFKQYTICDINGDNSEEFLLIYPSYEKEDGYALYIISESGNVKTVPLDIEFNNANDLLINGVYYEDNAESPYFKLYTHTNTIKDSADGVQRACTRYFNVKYEIIKTLFSESTPDKYIQTEDGEKYTGNYLGRQSEFENSLNLYEVYSDISFLDLETYIDNPSDLEEIIEKRYSQTPLNRAVEYSNDKSYCFLYDFTGDKFPEILMIYGNGTYMDYEYSICSMSGSLPEHLMGGALDDGGIIYIYRDGDQRFILSKYTSYMSSYENIYAERFDISENGISNSSIVGNAEIYFGSEKSYNSKLFFDGSDVCPLGMYNNTSDTPSKEEKTHIKFNKEFEKYLSRFEIIDEISIGYVDYDLIFKTKSQQCEFADYPTKTESPKINTSAATEKILIGNTYYPADTTTIELSAEDIQKYFDFDILNKFENLSSVSFYSDADSREKIIVKPSKWCEKITDLRINPQVFDIENGFSCFKNVTFLSISGQPESLDFVNDMPKIELLRPDFRISDKELLRPLTELPNLAVIVDSGIYSTLEGLPRDEWDDVIAMFPDCLWVMIK